MKKEKWLLLLNTFTLLCTQICFFYLMILSDSFQSQKRVLRPKYKSIKSGLPFLK